MLQQNLIISLPTYPKFCWYATGTTHIFHSVIMLPAQPASFAHNFVSGMQSFYFSESQDAIVLQTCH